MYKGPNHKYTCAPLVGVNKALPEDQRCTVVLTVSPYSEQEAENIEQSIMYASMEKSKWGAANAERIHAMVKKHFHGATNVSEEFEDCQDFDDFILNADPEIVQWVFGAVMKAEVLTRAEVKN